MINVLLVEDELIVRSGMKSLIDWNSHGFDLVADVRHGEEALQVLQQEVIDIVITDIRMPVMDGLELMKEIEKRCLKCAVIVLSSFDEFEYVRESMRYGAKDYIHKPTMTPHELLQTLHRVVTEIKKSTVVSRYEEMLQETVVESREMILTKVCQQLLNLESVDSKMFDILAGLPIIAKPVRMILLRFVHPFLKNNNSEVIEFTEEHIMKKLALLKGEQARFVYLKQGNHWVIIQTENDQVTKEQIDHKTKEDDHFDVIVVHCNKTFSFQQLGSVYQKLLLQLEEKHEEWEEQHRLHEIIYEALRYIDEHYMKPMSLENLCEVVHASPTYFSRLFYKETGSNFIDYLTNYRIEKAKKLLVQTDLRNYEISERIGYKNSKYFMKVFKKYTGKTPREYREQERGC